MLCSYQRFTYLLAEGGAPTYLFTDTEYCHLSTGYEFILENGYADSILDIGTYSVEGDEIILDDDNKTRIKSIGVRKVNINDSDDPSLYKWFEGESLKDDYFEYTGLGESQVENNREILNKLKKIYKDN